MSPGLAAGRRGPRLESLPTGRVVVVGFARTGKAAARVLAGAGAEVVVVEDSPGPTSATEAAALGAELVGAPSRRELNTVLDGAELVVVSPGVPPRHAVFALAGTDRIVSEVELAGQVAGVPIVAVTGTNGKTTVTALSAAMLSASGIACAAAGNIGVPLLEVVADPAVELVVAEVSSFQLAFTHHFRPRVAAWLNVAADHLDWHGSEAAYVAAKERIFANQDPSDTAVANAEDPVVLQRAWHSRARLVSFGLERGVYRLSGDDFVGPSGPLAPRSLLGRTMPHDLANALAALAIATEAGAAEEGCRAALEAWRPMPHRVSRVGVLDGVAYYDDSKATTPSAVAAALSGFDAVVLVAGGRNKGLDLSVLADAGVRDGRSVVRGVVAIGEAAGEVSAAFAELGCPVQRAASMDEAVALASRLALPGEAVLLSPGCASFDWYGSYEERGDDFARAVAELSARRGREADASKEGAR